MSLSCIASKTLVHLCTDDTRLNIECTVNVFSSSNSHTIVTFYRNKHRSEISAGSPYYINIIYHLFESVVPTDGTEMTYIVDWYSCHTQLIEALLTRCCVTWNYNNRIRWHSDIVCFKLQPHNVNKNQASSKRKKSIMNGTIWNDRTCSDLTFIQIWEKLV